MITKFKKHSTGPVDVFNSNGDLIISLSPECTIKNVPNDILSFFNGGIEVWRSTWIDMYDYDTNLSLGPSISQVVGELRNTYFFKSGSTGGTVTADNVLETSSRVFVSPAEKTMIQNASTKNFAMAMAIALS